MTKKPRLKLTDPPDSGDPESAAPSEVERAGAVTQGVITKVVDDLLRDTSAATPRLFFPNGIELIDVSVSLGLTSKGVEVKVKIAGEKGLKTLGIENEESPIDALAASSGHSEWADQR